MGCRPPRGPGRRRILSSPGNQPIVPDVQVSDLVVNFLTPLGSPDAQSMQQQQQQVPDVRWNGPFVNLTGKPVLNTPCGWRALRISST